jgi:hypothetical protein
MCPEREDRQRVMRPCWIALAIGCGHGATTAPPDQAVIPGVVELAPGIVEPYLLAVDDTYVYFSSSGAEVGTTGKIQRVAKAGGDVTDLVTGLGVPYGIAVDADYVYFTDRLANALERVPKTGGSPAVIASAQPHCNRIAMAATNIYWTNSGATEDHDGSLVTMPLAGGTPVVLAAGLADPEAIAVDATDVYWTNTSAGEPATVMRTRSDGSQTQPTTLATNLDYPIGIALDDTTLYWANQDGVMNVAKTSDGSIAPAYVAANQNGTKEVVVVAQRVYWTTSDAVVAAGTTLATVYLADGLALDDTYVYFVAEGSLTNPGGVYRVPR